MTGPTACPQCGGYDPHTHVQHWVSQEMYDAAIARVRQLERSQGAEFEAAEQGLMRAEAAEKRIAELEAEIKGNDDEIRVVFKRDEWYRRAGEIIALEADKARLDWLEKPGVPPWPMVRAYVTRKAVDEAMALEITVANHSSDK